MTLVTLTAFAQYPTTKNIKGTQVVIMTVPQAQDIDNKFIKFKDSIEVLNVSLIQNRENLKITSQALINKNNDLSKTQDSLKHSFLQNEIYLKEIEKYKKMEFEDKKVSRKVSIGFATAAVVWVFYVITALTQ